MADGNFIGSQIDGQHTCFSELPLQLIVNKAAKESSSPPSDLYGGTSLHLAPPKPGGYDPR